MAKAVVQVDSATRRHLLAAAAKCFARHGYAATSVQEIVRAARVSKPVLYYYFKDKADLFRVLVHDVHDERYRLMQRAAERGRTVAEKLEEILTAIFQYSIRNQPLMRLAFATAFAATDEVPARTDCAERGRRNFDFIRALVLLGQADGELDAGFPAAELAMGIYSQLNTYVMVRLLVPDCPLNRESARQIVRLFLQGAAGSSGAPRRQPVSK